MIWLNSPKGLGDAIHVRAVVLHLLKQGEEITVFTLWPDVFDNLPVSVRPADEAKQHLDLTSARACVQCMVPHIRGLSQFRNVCLQAGILEPIDLDIEWSARNSPLLDGVLSKADRPILIFQPLKRVNNEEDELRRPNVDAFDRLIAGHEDHFTVRIGHPQFVEDMPIACDLDLFGKLSVTDAIDLVTIADLVCSEPSYLGILAQAFDKKLECLFSARGLRSKVKSVAGATPERLFHKKQKTTAIYDEA